MGYDCAAWQCVFDFLDAKASWAKALQMKNANKVNVGDESVVFGSVQGNVGSKSVVIGATDAKGNVRIDQSMAIGHGAEAGPGCIAIGAGAKAGRFDLGELADALSQLEASIRDDPSAVTHQENLEHLRAAAEAASANDAATTWRHLQSVGNWGLEVAKAVGANLAAAAIASSLGIS